MSTLPISKQIIVDFFIFLIVCVPMLLMHVMGRPTSAGFWCHDQSLSYPYKPDTVTSSLLMVISLAGPFLVMALTESIRAVVSTRLHRRSFRTEMTSFAKAYGVFVFGLATSCIFVDSIKLTVGRLRPHFFDVCKPNLDRINCTTDESRNRWVSENCQKVKVILKMDDDVILDVHRFFEEFWFPPPYQQELIFCHVWKLGEVERVGKWGISYEDYKLDHYPPYCSGFIVVVMPAIVEDLYHAALGTPFLWLDDVFIYGVVREEVRDVQIVNLDEVAYREEHYYACYRQFGYRYIVDYECTNTLVEQKLLHDSRMSFPSGHSAISFYSALFTIFYLQMRMHVSFSHLLRPVLQMCLMMLALLCSVTRITDHKHFASDVVAGWALGLSIAWLVFYKIGQKVIPSVPIEKRPRLPRATSVESEPQTPTPLLRPERLVINHSYRNDNGSMHKDDFVNKV